MKMAGIPGDTGYASFGSPSAQRQNVAVGMDFRYPTGLRANDSSFRLQFDSFNYIQVQINNDGYSLLRVIDNIVEAVGDPLPPFGDETTNFHRIKLLYEDSTGHVEAFVDDRPLGVIEDKLVPSSLTDFQFVFYNYVIEGQNIEHEWDNFSTTIFADVPASYWAWRWIERLFDAGITNGCVADPLLYCPEQSVTRAQMAKFLEKGINGSAYTPPLGTGMVFADVPASYWAVDWIEQLYADGITSGCVLSPLTYCPDDPVTRAQMAKFLMRAEHGAAYTPPDVGASTGFNDVSTSYWAAVWIKQLAVEGITSGCGSGNYCPDNSVTRAEMAKFLVLTFSLP